MAQVNCIGCGQKCAQTLTGFCKTCDSMFIQSKICVQCNEAFLDTGVDVCPKCMPLFELEPARTDYSQLIAVSPSVQVDDAAPLVLHRTVQRHADPVPAQAPRKCAKVVTLRLCKTVEPVPEPVPVPEPSAPVQTTCRCGDMATLGKTMCPWCFKSFNMKFHSADVNVPSPVAPIPRPAVAAPDQRLADMNVPSPVARIPRPVAASVQRPVMLPRPVAVVAPAMPQRAAAVTHAIPSRAAAVAPAIPSRAAAVAPALPPRVAAEAPAQVQTVCGCGNMATPGKNLCLRCFQSYVRKLAIGKCLCGKPSTSGKTMCPECFASYSQKKF